MNNGYEDNLTLQADEIEALTAIYGSDFKIEDAERQIYSINIKYDNKEVILQVTFPSEYPSSSPPFYQLSAPWMKREDKAILCSSFDDIYFKNVGENIIHHWIEEIRTLLQEKFDKPDDATVVKDAQIIKNNEQSLLISKAEFSDETPVVFHGTPLTDRRSTFQAHLATVFTTEQVKQVLLELKENRKIASATHNIYAYRIYLASKNTFTQDCDDDGETHAGSRLFHLLQILDIRNVLIVVSRWYGGIHLGPDRFKHINNVARDILEEYGIITKQDRKTDTRIKKKCK